MRSVRQLYDLQQVDWDIQRREEELVDVQARLADDSRRIASKRRLDALEAKLDELSRPRREAEDTVQQIEQRIAAIDQRLYSGTVTNPRELEAYQDERAMLVRNQGEQEDRLLEFLVEIEDTQAQRDEARTVFERIHAERSQEVGELNTKQAELTSELANLKAERQSIAPEYPPQVLAVYETVRRSRGGQGAALVDNRGLCQGCRLVIPTNELNRVRAGEEIVQCSSCTRILIYS